MSTGAVPRRCRGGRLNKIGVPGRLSGDCSHRDAARRSGEYVEKVPSVVSITTRYRRVVNSLEFCLEFRLLSTVPLANLQEVRRSMVIR